MLCTGNSLQMRQTFSGRVEPPQPPRGETYLTFGKSNPPPSDGILGRSLGQGQHKIGQVLPSRDIMPRNVSVPKALVSHLLRLGRNFPMKRGATCAALLLCL